MIGLELSPDNKFAAAYTNNNQTILLNTLISEFFIIDNPLGNNTVHTRYSCIETCCCISKKYEIYKSSGGDIKIRFCHILNEISARLCLVQ